MNNSLTNKFIKDLVDIADAGDTSVEEVIADIVQRDFQSIRKRMAEEKKLLGLDADTLEIAPNEQ